MAGLVADYNSESSDEESSDSSSESDDSECDENEDDTKTETVQERLPLPDILNEKPQANTNKFRLAKTAESSASDSSVFFNPFKAKEAEKLAILEKHVKLTERKDETKTEKNKYSRKKKGPFQQKRQNFYQKNDGDDDGGFKAPRKRKTRVGVSDSLIPPKKALDAYVKQSEGEKRI